MKILVLDDNENNLRAAQVQLKDHEVTPVNGFFQARAALSPQVDWDLYKQRMRERFPSVDVKFTFQIKDDGEREAYKAFGDQLEKELAVHPKFDAVLTDMMMPPPDFDALNREYRTGEHPLGLIIVIHALIGGIKNVALVTDASHHQSPMSAALDAYHERGFMGLPVGEDIRILMINNPRLTGVHKETFEPFSGDRADVVYVKNWKFVLECLFSDKPIRL